MADDKVDTLDATDGKDPNRVVRILNLPDEPAFQLRFDPKQILFKFIAPNPSFSEIRITNTTDKKQWFKIKTTNNRLFRMQPSVGFIQSGQTVFIKLTLNDTSASLPDNFHYFGIFHLASNTSDTKEAVKQMKNKADGIVRVRIVFEREGGAAAEDAKGTAAE